MGTDEIRFREPTASDPAARLRSSPTDPPRGDEPQRIMAFLEDGLAVDPEQPGELPNPDGWRALRRPFPGVVARSPFGGVLDRHEMNAFDECTRAADASRQRRRLASFVEVVMPPGSAAAGLAFEMLPRVRALDGVADAYLVSRKAPLPQVNVPQASRVADQFYLDRGPTGIDAAYALRDQGSDGHGITIVDVERAWWRDHPDLPQNPQVEHIGGAEEPIWADHGTAVLGLLVARNDGKGVVGIAPGATAKTVATMIGPGDDASQRIEAAILAAVKAPHMHAGDVLLIEEQTDHYLPVEIERANREAIIRATDAGIVVVEAAANGGLNLDLERWDDQSVLARSTPDFEDSGAIIVGAATTVPPQTAILSSNHGARVDCFAHGREVVTTDPNKPVYYVDDFSGTSAAAAIVAGAAAVVQAHLEGLGVQRLNSRQMRWVLSTHTSVEAQGAHRIGGLPDLHRIIRGKVWEGLPADVSYT